MRLRLTLGETLGRRFALAASLVLAWSFGPIGLIGSIGPITAQPSVDPSSPQIDPLSGHFLIEEIEVENAVTFSSRIILSASRLESGRTYSERDLRAAIARIVQLPLVLDAEASLRRGSERGRYILVLRVEETRRWFLGIDSTHTLWAQEVSITGLETTDWVETGAAFAGRRFSIGPRGVFYLVASGGDGMLTAGYSQHDVLDRGILLNASLSISDCSSTRSQIGANETLDEGCQTHIYGLDLDPTFASWSSADASALLRINVGIPLRGNQSLRLQGSARSSERGLRRNAYLPRSSAYHNFGELRHQELAVAWVVDSVDDPIFPTSGWSLEGGLETRRLFADLTAVGPPGSQFPFESSFRSEVFGLGVQGQHHRTRGRHTFSWGGRLFIGHSDLDDVPDIGGQPLSGGSDLWRARVSASHSALLFLQRSERSWRELRWVSRAALLTGGSSPDFDQPDNPLSGFELSTGLAFRTTWGVFQFRLTYFDAEGR